MTNRDHPKDAPTPGVARDDEIDLAELIGKLWEGRWLIALVTGTTLLLAVLYLHLATYRYTAQLTLTPAQNAGSQLTSRMGGLGGLASLAGVSLPQDSSAMAFSLYVEGVHSRVLADAVANHPDLMRIVFEEEWNAVGEQWREPTGLVATTVRTAKGILGAPLADWRAPDGARLQEFTAQEVGISQDPREPFVTLTFNHKDPEFAARFLDTLHHELDNLLRQRALLRTTGNIAYLSDQLGKVTIAEHRQAIAATLSEQEKQRMSASSSAPYAADPFGPANVSRTPTSPRPVLVLIGGILLGMVAGGALVLIRARAS